MLEVALVYLAKRRVRWRESRPGCPLLSPSEGLVRPVGLTRWRLLEERELLGSGALDDSDLARVFT
jgi:hypothetical protein